MTEQVEGRAARVAADDAAAGARRSWIARLGAWLPPRRPQLYFGRWLGLALLGALLVVRVWDPAPIETLRFQTFDLYQLMHPRVSPPQPVLIVDIDEESLAELGQWPWPRTVIAKLVGKLRDASAIAIGFDVVFPEPDRVSIGLMAETLPGLSPELRQQLSRLPTNDQIMANAIRGARVVLGQSAYPRDLNRPDRTVSSPPIATLGGDPRPYLPKFPDFVGNIDTLDKAAAGHGMFTLVPDRGGIVRRIPGALVVRDTIVPTLVLEMLRVATGQRAFLIKTDQAGIKSYVVGGVELPTDRNGRIWVYFGKHDPNLYVSAADVLAGRVPPQRLANKLVLIGGSATGLFDIKATPLSPAMPGVEVHAQILETILTRNYLVRPNYALGAEVVLTAVIGLLMIAIVPVVGALWTLVLGSVVSASVAGVSWYLFVADRVLIDVAYPLIAGLALYGLMVFASYFREETRRREVRRAFNQYLSPDLVEELARNPDRLSLGGETRDMTILFCDAQGFTTIAEGFKADPQGLTRLMNRLLTPLTSDIISRRGTIDKYIGDAIMAFWNAPVDVPEHPANACDAALAMIASLNRLNDARAQEALAFGQQATPLNIGIGINSGACVVGNFGSDQRFDYSVLGDTVNLASRLEGLTRVYSVEILVGSATAGEAAGRFALLELDRVRVKGKSEPETIFALLGDADMAGQPDFAGLSAQNAAMLAAYRRREWDSASTALNAGRTLAAQLGVHLSGYYDYIESLIDDYRKVPPPPDWAGVNVFSTK